MDYMKLKSMLNSVYGMTEEDIKKMFEHADKSVNSKRLDATKVEFDYGNLTHDMCGGVDGDKLDEYDEDMDECEYTRSVAIEFIDKFGQLKEPLNCMTSGELDALTTCMFIWSQAVMNHIAILWKDASKADKDRLIKDFITLLNS